MLIVHQNWIVVLRSFLFFILAIYLKISPKNEDLFFGLWLTFSNHWVKRELFFALFILEDNSNDLCRLELCK